MPVDNHNCHMDEMISRTQELLARLERMNTAVALPGDSSMRWHDDREECFDIIADLSVGLHLMAVPE